VEAWPDFVKYIIIPLLPNQPSSYDEHLHDEFVSKMVSSLIHHRIKVRVEIPVNIKGAPAGLAERARKKR
jgi:hypothetical protein